MKYNHVDQWGGRWRFVGARPVSEIADRVMRDCGMRLPREPKPRKERRREQAKDD